MDKPKILTSALQPEPRTHHLLAAVNSASESAQAGWIVLLALTAFYAVALGGVNDRDLLLNSPITLPLLNISISLHRFFFFAPLIYIFIHFGVLIQHVVLANKAYALAAVMEGQEITETALYGRPSVHPLRYELSSNFFTQFVAGPPESGLIRAFQKLMVWNTLLFLPLTVLVAFQIVFLPFHDVATTWLHRCYVAVDIAALALAGVFLPSAERHFWSAFGSGLARYPGFYAITALAFAGFFLFAFGAATIPGEWLEQKLAVPSLSLTVPVAGDSDGPPRRLFVPTAYLFEGPLNAATGRARSPFHRNLIVIDEVFGPRDFASGRTSLSLRYRDLRFARFDRTDLGQADLACADLTGAVLSDAKLDGAKMDCPSH
jgi:hypothetical protein